MRGQLGPAVPIVTAARKRLLLEKIASEEGIPLSETLCVGDGANDLDMLKAVGAAGGMGVAFKAKDAVQRDAPNKLNGRSLLDLLYLTVRNEAEVRKLIDD